MAMSVGSSPSNNSKQRTTAKQLSARVSKCWDMDFDWEHIPQKLKEVSSATEHTLKQHISTYLHSEYSVDVSSHTPAGMRADWPSFECSIHCSLSWATASCWFCNVPFCCGSGWDRLAGVCFAMALNSNANRDGKIASLQVFEAVGEASS